MQKMKIVLIGAGRLSVNMGRALFNAGHDIIQVYSRTIESAQNVATIVGGAPTTDIDSINKGADVYIVMVKDSVIANLIPSICKGREQKVFIHTAGSIPLHVFQGMALHYGVLYPLQSFSREREADFSTIPCFIEASDEYASNTIIRLASSISNNVKMLASEDRKYLHLAAVFACNFVNHCYTIAGDILSAHGIPFDTLLPLIDETARKVHAMPPAEAQTGPAMRYDENVIRNQSMLLSNIPPVKDIYERMSLNIHRKTKGK